jgi:hypothetical protein
MSAMDAERGPIEDVIDEGDLGRLVRKYDAQTPGFRARVIAALCTPATTIQRIPADERVTFADLYADNWRSVEHEAVRTEFATPCSPSSVGMRAIAVVCSPDTKATAPIGTPW